MKKTISIILSIIFVLAVMPVTVGFAADEVYLKGDINLDKAITVEDSRLIMRASIGLDKTPSSGSAEFNRMKLTSSLPEKVTMEDARMALRVAVGLTDYTTFYTKAELVSLFNTLANKVKSTEFKKATKMAYANAQTVSSDLYDYDFGEFNTLIEKMLKEDDSLVQPETTSYPTAAQGRSIYDFIYPVTNQNYVSALTADDVANITISFNQKANVLSDYPERIGNVSLSDLKAINCKSALKIHVDIITEKYSSGANENSAFNHIVGISLAETAAEYTMKEVSSDGLFDFSISSECKEITTNASVDYYFSADTLTPIAAVYTVSEKIDVGCTMIISAEGEVAVNGTMSQICNAKDKTVYVFTEYYKNN